MKFLKLENVFDIENETNIDNLVKLSRHVFALKAHRRLFWSGFTFSYILFHTKI